MKQQNLTSQYISMHRPVQLGPLKGKTCSAKNGDLMIKVCIITLILVFIERKTCCTSGKEWWHTLVGSHFQIFAFTLGWINNHMKCQQMYLSNLPAIDKLQIYWLNIHILFHLGV